MDDLQSKAAIFFERRAFERGLIISRRFPGPMGYEYRLHLPGEPRNGRHWYFLLDLPRMTELVLALYVEMIVDKLTQHRLDTC